MLCKEPGITVLGVCSAYDIYVAASTSLPALLPALLRQGTPTRPGNPAPLRALALRQGVLLIAGVAICALRLSLNAGGAPEFAWDQNPPSFAEVRCP